MPGDSFRTSNHYVPQFYLKNFACAPGIIQEYSLLVSHPTVRDWSRRPISKVASMDHLYTTVTENAESDRIERWLQKEFEGPADDAMQLAIADAPMKPKHYRDLVRYFALQDLRTPKNYLRSLRHYEENFKSETEETLNRTIQELTAAKAEGRAPVPLGPGFEDNDLLDLKTLVLPSPDDPSMANIHVQLTVGRHTWLHSLLFILKRGEALKHLLRHKWTILHAPAGSQFLTCDHPVVKLGLNANGSRNLVGGWGAPNGGVLMMPLSPDRLLFSQIGVQPPLRSTELPAAKVDEVNRSIAANALRSVFGQQPLPMETIRKRRVDSAMFLAEKRDRQNWHTEQSKAVRSPPKPVG